MGVSLLRRHEEYNNTYVSAPEPSVEEVPVAVEAEIQPEPKDADTGV